METTKSLATQATQAIFISNQAIQATAVAETPQISSPSEASPPLTPMPAINPTDSNASKEERPKVFNGSRAIGIDDLLIRKNASTEKTTTTGWFGRFYPNSSNKNPPPTLKSSSPLAKHHQVAQQQLALDREKELTSPKSILKKPKPIDNEALNRLLEKNLVIERSVHIPPQEIRRMTLTRIHQNHSRSFSSNSSDEGSARRYCRLSFNKLVEVCETHGAQEYDRSNIDFIAKSLNPALVLAIKKELNEIKGEMIIHKDSRLNTQFYALPQPNPMSPDNTSTKSNPASPSQHVPNGSLK